MAGTRGAHRPNATSARRRGRRLAVVAASLGVIYSLVVRSIIRGLDEATERKS